MSEAQLRRISYLRSIVKDKDAEIEHQAARIEQLEDALREFCDRVDRGEVRSVKTYARFKKLLE